MPDGKQTLDIGEVLKLAGGPVLAAQELGLSKSATSQWDAVPAVHVIKLCELTGWRITPHEMRPDIYPYPTDALPRDKVGELRRIA